MIGLFFGSFNPVHKGHVAVAHAALQSSLLAEIWFVVSPMNPFKEEAHLAPAIHRLEMLRGVLCNEPKMKAVDVELKLPTPSFTCNTLNHLSSLYPNIEFVLIVGWDTYQSMPRWQRADEVLKYRKLVYPRGPSALIRASKIPDGWLLNQPLLDISATDIRRKITAGEDCTSELETHTVEYIQTNGLYL